MIAKIIVVLAVGVALIALLERYRRHQEMLAAPDRLERLRRICRRDLPV